MSTKLKISLEAVKFTKYLPPRGFLFDHPACHALFRYAVSAKHVIDTQITDPIVFEGEEDPQHDFRQMMMSWAMAYGVKPEEMVKFWLNVDMQFDLLKLQRVPNVEWVRFNAVPEIGFIGTEATGETLQ